MRISLTLLVAILVGFGCKSTKPSPDESPQAAPREPVQADTEAGKTDVPESDAPKPAAGCAPLDGDADALYAEAEAFEVAGKEYSPERRAARAKKIELYKQAALAGHVEAQHKAGSMLFGDLYQADEPTPEQRDQYVEAIMLVMTAAARREDKDPLASSIGNAKQLPAELDGPLAEIPREWVEEAFAQSRKWLACYAPGWDSK